jgi:hypothetical protein
MRRTRNKNYPLKKWDSNYGYNIYQSATRVKVDVLYNGKYNGTFECWSSANSFWNALFDYGEEHDLDMAEVEYIPHRRTVTYRLVK